MVARQDHRTHRLERHPPRVSRHRCRAYLNQGETKVESFTITLTDQNGATITRQIDVTIVGAADNNDAPDGVNFSLATGLGTASSNSGNLKAGDIVGSFTAFGDTDPGDTFTYTLGSGSSSNFTLSSAGVMSVTTNTGGGTYQTSVIAEDAVGHKSPATYYTIWVGDNSNNGTTAQSFADNPNSVIAFGVNGAETIIGSAFDDALSGGKGDDALTGAAGNDTLFGGDGSDTFVFAASAGKDIVADFHSGEDLIEISTAYFADFDALFANAVSGPTDTVITIDADNSITLKNVTSIQQSDFHFV